MNYYWMYEHMQLQQDCHQHKTTWKKIHLQNQCWHVHIPNNKKKASQCMKLLPPRYTSLPPCLERLFSWHPWQQAAYNSIKMLLSISTCRFMQFTLTNIDGIQVSWFPILQPLYSIHASYTLISSLSLLIEDVLQPTISECSSRKPG